VTYYLIDDAKVRQILEVNLVSRNNIRVNDYGYNIYLKNVWYLINPKTLEVKQAASLSTDSFVLTTRGYVSWQNSSKIIKIVSKPPGYTFSLAIFRSDTTEKLFNIQEDIFAFCSGYICLGSLPSKQIRINKNDMVLLGFDDIFKVRVADIKSLNKLNVEAEKNKNELIMYVPWRSKKNVIHYTVIGINVNNTIYVIGGKAKAFNQIGESLSVYPDIIILTKGTCFKTNAIVDPNSKKIIKDKELHEFCYE